MIVYKFEVVTIKYRLEKIYYDNNHYESQLYN